VEAVTRIKNLEHVKLAIAFVGLNVLDAILTNAILSRGGIELNPLMRYLFGQPKWVAWTFEIGGTIVVTFAFLLIATVYPRLVKIIFIALIVLMSAVCLYNVVGLF